MILLLALAACSGVSAQDGSDIPQEDPSHTPTQTSSATSTAPAEQPVRADLEDLGPAPELENEVWLNSDQPLRLTNLSGKVVLIDMWTFG
jgi:hypothetical protein